MAFCTECGHQLAEGAKFCFECGAKVNAPSSQTEQRKTVYDGEIHKCPNCGEVLNSFISTCPACGYELRNTRVSTSIKEFAEKVIETETEEQKISLIRNYPIPNTKEDIFEFMILASSNIDSNTDKRVSDAWLTKMEQSYQKGKLIFGNDLDFSEIERAYTRAYDKIKSDVKTRKRKSILNLALHTIGVWAGLIVFLIAFIIDVAPGYHDTSIYHVGAAAIMIIGAYVIKKRKNSPACAGVGIACGVLSMLLGTILPTISYQDGSMMMVAGGAVIILSVANLLASFRRKD